jgi:hypothetical protein
MISLFFTEVSSRSKKHHLKTMQNMVDISIVNGLFSGISMEYVNQLYYCLVVLECFGPFFHSIGSHTPIWRTHIFQRGGEKPPIRLVDRCWQEGIREGDGSKPITPDLGWWTSIYQPCWCKVNRFWPTTMERWLLCKLVPPKALFDVCQFNKII